MATQSPLCYYRLLTKGENMDYENDYNLLEDVAEEIDVWEDLEDQDEDEEQF
jgi:hypothetical protein